MKLKALIPLSIFLGLALLFVFSLDRNTRLVPSPLIGKPAPDFNLPQLSAPGGISPQALKGRPWLLNVWASWCGACRQEHHFLNQLTTEHDINMLGLNYKDEPAMAQQWLQQFGDPYRWIAVDNKGSAGLDWGVYGVPETFLIDADGIIQYKHIGPINQQVIDKVILPFFAGEPPR
jgi:cytochrome c biogenesis protein CcmG/thiol:disulfide interchange protein DsbE